MGGRDRRDLKEGRSVGDYRRSTFTGKKRGVAKVRRSKKGGIGVKKGNRVTNNEGKSDLTWEWASGKVTITRWGDFLPVEGRRVQKKTLKVRAVGKENQ